MQKIFLLSMVFLVLFPCTFSFSMDSENITMREQKRRVEIACTSCRKSKTKCDQGQPCHRCAQRNQKCVRVSRWQTVNSESIYSDLLEESLRYPFQDLPTLKKKLEFSVTYHKEGLKRASFLLERIEVLLKEQESPPSHIIEGDENLYPLFPDTHFLPPDFQSFNFEQTQVHSDSVMNFQ